MNGNPRKAMCARCGACLPVCPVYRNTLLERFAPRGKHALVHDRKVDFSLESVKETVSACLQCGACESTCSAGIAVNREILSARAENAEFAPSWPALWKFFSSDAAWSSLAGLLSALPAASGILYRLASMAVSGSGSRRETLPWPASVPLLSHEGLHRFFHSLPTAPAANDCNFPLAGKRVALFSGCVQNFIYPEIPAAMAAWFPGTEFVVPAHQCCCGLPALSAGAVEASRRLVERNLRVFQETECDVILTGCASCRYMIDKWPEIAGPDAREMAEQTAARTMEFTELLNDTDCALPESSATGITAFHAPCHSRFTPRGTEAAEAFLHRILGNNFVEIEQGCCGHGGSFSMKHGEISSRIFQERVDALKDSGASAIVTTCSGCLLQWRGMAAKHGLEDIQILHAAEIMQHGLCP